MWVLPARRPTTSDAIEGVVSSGSITGVILGGPFGSPVTESRSVLGSGASGRRSGAGVGERPQWHGPSLMGQNASLPQPKSESAAGTGSPQQLTEHTEGHFICEWYPDGRGLLVRARRDAPGRSGWRFYRIDRRGKVENT